MLGVPLLRLTTVRLLAGSLPALAALVAMLALASPAMAAEETIKIDFDNLPSLTRVTNQYEAEGAIFGSPSDYGFAIGEPANGVAEAPAFCGPPWTREDAFTSSLPNEATISCGGGEFPEAGTFGVLTNYARKVTAKVGDAGANGENVFRLDAYNVEKELIGHAEATSYSQGINATISFEAGGFEIAYFAIWRTRPIADEGFFTGIDDVELVTSSELAPAISVASTLGGRIAQGTQMHGHVSIVRHNHSQGSVELSANGLPNGVTANFEPDTLTGTETKSEVTLTADSGAPIEELTGAIVATPLDIKAGKVAASVPVTLSVVAPFSVYVGLASSIPASTNITVPPCSTAAVGVRTTTEPGFTEPVTLALSTEGATPDVSSLSLEKYLLEPGDFGAGVNQQVLHLARNGASAPSGSFRVYVAGRSGVFAEPAATVNVTRGPPTVSSVNPNAGHTPQGLQPGTPVTISGSGFCPGSTVQFGNSSAIATPTSVNSNGTQLTVNVPTLATTGPVSVISGGVAGASASPMTIDSYRNVNGYQFHNYLPSIDFEQLTDAFGESQTYDTIDLCWPFGCNVSFRDPFAMILNAIANASLDSGACFGMSLSSQRFLEGDRALSEFPPGGASNIFGLDSHGAPSAQLTNFINAMHVSQLSTEFLSHWLGASTSQGTAGGVSMSQSVYAEIRSSFERGEHPLVALQNGGEGHVVIAYDLEGAPGNYYIDVYDSNLPFGEGGDETSDGKHHDENWERSRIHVGSDGEWSLPSTGISGGVTGLVVTAPRELPTHPTMPTGLGLLKAIGGGLFGSAGPGDTAGSASAPAPASNVTQLTDAAGHTLYQPDGRLNYNPATRLQAAPFAPLVGSSGHSATTKTGAAQMIVLPPDTGILHATVTGTGAGPDTHTLIGHDFAGQIDTTSANGAKDTLTLVPGAGEIGFATQLARKPLTLMLVGALSKERRTAQISTMSFRGPGDMLAFTGSQNGLTFTHHGTATTFSLTLSGLGPRSAPTVFQSGPLHIGANESARIGAIRWSSLGSSTVRMTIGGRSIVVANHARSAHLASIRTLTAKRGRRGTVSLTIATGRRHLPTGARLAFVWTVRSAGRLVSTHAQVAAANARSASYTFKPKGRGHFTLTAVVVVVTISGVTQSSSEATRKLTFTV